MRLQSILTFVFSFVVFVAFANDNNNNSKSAAVKVVAQKTEKVSTKKATDILNAVKSSTKHEAVIINDSSIIVYQPIFEQSKIKMSKRN